MPTSRDTAKVIQFTGVNDVSNVTDAPNVADVDDAPNVTAPNITAPNITVLGSEPTLFAHPDVTPIGLDASGDLTIDCECCTLRDTAACDDCVVSFLLEREPEDAVVIDADEARAMRMLERAGLLPTLRFSTEAG
jgi:hypothetical protein